MKKNSKLNFLIFVILFAFIQIFSQEINCKQSGKVINGVTNYNLTTEGTGKFFHISDWHVDPFYSPLFTPSTFCRNETAFLHDIIELSFLNRTKNGIYQPNNHFDEGYKGDYQFGQYGCDSPLLLAQSAGKAMKNIEKDPDFILYTGDLSAHNLPTWNTRSLSINVTAQLLRQIYPNTLIFPTLGNNDCFPDDDLRLKPDLEPKKWLENVWMIWNEYLDVPDEEYDRFIRSGYFSVKINDKLTVISMNTIYLYTSHRPSINATKDRDPAGQFAWMESLLLSALSSSSSIYIIGHVPPGSDWQSPFVDSYQSLLSKYSNVISGQFFGHTHSDQFAVIYDDPNLHLKVISSYFVTPSLTPRDSNNPTFRIVSYDRNDTSLNDYFQYYADLVGATRNGVVDFRLEYQFTKLYSQLKAQSEDVYNAVELIYSDPIYYNIWLLNLKAQYSDAADKERNICKSRSVILEFRGSRFNDKR